MVTVPESSGLWKAPESPSRGGVGPGGQGARPRWSDDGDLLSVEDYRHLPRGEDPSAETPGGTGPSTSRGPEDLDPRLRLGQDPKNDQGVHVSTRLLSESKRADMESKDSSYTPESLGGLSL